MTSRRTPKPAQIFRPLGITPFRDRTVPSRKVACPTCDVAAGQRCVDKNGEPCSNTHVARRRAAIREGL